MADQVRTLREWFRRFEQRHRGEPLSRSASGELKVLSGLLARDETFTQIMARAEADTRDGETALALVARRR